MLRVSQKAVSPILAQAARRTYVSVAQYEREEVAEKVTKLRDTVLGTNWADYLNLVQNVPFWEAECEKITTAATPYVADPDLGAKIDEIYRTFDCMYACEDVRDHINELLELSTRASGIMGIGINAAEKVDNIEEQVELVVKEYEDLLERYPEFKPKVEQTVGHGLALFRQKTKFRFSSMHRFFF